MRSILIVDDDVAFGMLIDGFLQRNGYETTVASSCSSALEIINKQSFDIVLTDYRLPDGNGLDVLHQIKKLHPNTIVLLITAYSEIKIAVKAIKDGAFDYITKPVNPQELLHIIEKSSPKNEKKKDNKAKNNAKYLSATSDTKIIEEHINLVAPTDISVLIQGESGTGKEIIARRIHDLSPRHKAPFIAVDCGALTQELASSELFGHIKGSFTGAFNDKEGHFETVADGTIFLDEIGNLNYDVQVKLLRAIQEKKARKIGSNNEFSINARIIAATNEDLRNDARSGHFREDLFHRINEFTIHTMPLRQRQNDLEAFMDFFKTEASSEFNKSVKDFSVDVIECFKYYSWPGNIRELKNVIRRSVLLADNDTITLKCIPEEIRQYQKDNPAEDNAQTLLNQAKSQSEKATIIEALEKTRYNKTKTSQLLGIDRKTLYNKLQKYKIKY